MGEEYPVSSQWFVEGDPAPQGSKRPFIHPTTKRVVLVESSGKKLKTWRETVTLESKSKPKFEGAVVVSLGFYLRRPRYHFRANGELKPTAPGVLHKKP